MNRRRFLGALCVISLAFVVVADGNAGAVPSWAYYSYQDYQSRPHYRAFTISRTTGKHDKALGYAYAGRTVDEAVRRATKACDDKAASYDVKYECELHSVGDIDVSGLPASEVAAAKQFYQRNRKATSDDFASRFTAGTAAMLLDAARIGDAAGVQTLLGQGVDVDARTDIGETALILAAFGGHAKTVEALLAGGADVNAKSNFGSTALMRAAFRHESLASTQLDVGGYREIIRLLEQAGARQ